jgi:hypothetical protein
MESLNIILTQKVNIALNVLEDFYNVALTRTDNDGVMRNIYMPVELNSPDGLYLKSLVSKVWDYIPDAAPDPLSQAKATKLLLINSQWAALEKTGWDTGLPQGHLGITPSDVALISGSFALAKEAANLGLPLPSLVTIENNELSFNSITEMLQLMLLYGQSRSQMSMEIASKRKAVENALTIEEVEAI